MVCSRVISPVISTPAEIFVPIQYHALKNHPNASPPIRSANQLCCLKSGRPETLVFWLIKRKHTSVRPRRKNQKAKVTIKLDRPDRTTMLPINHPKAKVIHKVMRNAKNGVASPMPKGRPHFIINAIDIPAKAIIGPIDRSNSPAIINKAAPTAMMPSCEIMAMLFFKPSALNALPSDATARAKMMMIITMNDPISGRRTIRLAQDSLCRRSDSLRSDMVSPFYNYEFLF